MPSTPSTPSPNRLTAPPKLTCGFPVPCCGSKNVVLPPNVTPSSGVKCHSADAARGASTRHRQHSVTARRMGKASRPLRRQLQEERGELRTGHVPLREVERRAEPVAVRQQDEREITCGELEDERRVRVR